MLNPFIYAVQPDGKLLWYRHTGQAEGTFEWQGSKDVGVGWNGFTTIFSGGNGIVYGIQENGDLLWYRHTGQPDGSFVWTASQGQKVSSGWDQFSTVFAGSGGVIYGIQNVITDVRNGQQMGGDLMWHRHDGYMDGSPNWASVKGRKVGNRWDGFTKVFSGGDGYIYGIQENGDLLWYRHEGRHDGTFAWAANSGCKVSSGWEAFSTVFSGGDGVIYGIQIVITEVRTGRQMGGDLMWHRHDGRADGSPTWASVRGRKVGNRWDGFITVISGGEDVTQATRCGVPDQVSGGIRIRSFGSPGGRWNRGSLTYNVNASGSGLSQAAVETVMANSFQQWQAAAPFFSFTRVSGGADIQIRFGGTSLDPKFGTPGGVAGSGAYPMKGRLNFDSSENWANGGLLNSTAMHEIGHVLGLTHSTNPSSLMHPYLNRATLDPETIRAIQSLYGWRPQTQLAGFHSNEGPSLAAAGFHSSRLYMAWKEVGGSGIYWSRFDGGAWQPQKHVPNVGSFHGPALAAGFTRNGPDGTPVATLFMAWDGVQGDSAIYFAENPDPIHYDFLSQTRIEGVGTSDRPALALFNGQMCMAWKGVAGDSGIYWSSYDGSRWQPQRAIRGRGTSHGPALVVLGNRLYMFWKGIGDDSRVFYSWIDNQPNGIWSPQLEVVYTDARTDGNVHVNIGTTHRPAAVVRGGAIALAWVGVRGDTGLYFASLENGEWSGQVNVAGVASSHGPSLALHDGRLVMAWKGRTPDSSLWSSSLG